MPNYIWINAKRKETLKKIIREQKKLQSHKTHTFGKYQLREITKCVLLPQPIVDNPFFKENRSFPPKLRLYQVVYGIYNAKIPLRTSKLDISHICGRGTCINHTHLKAESKSKNHTRKKHHHIIESKLRSKCRYGKKGIAIIKLHRPNCRCEPRCFMNFGKDF